MAVEPRLILEISEKGAAQVAEQLGTVDDLAEKLAKDIARLEDAAKLEEARKGCKAYQDAVERLAVAQGKATTAAQRQAEATKRLADKQRAAEKRARKLGESIVALNQGLDLAGRLASTASAFGDFALEGALANDAANRFSGSLERLRAASAGMVDDTSLFVFANMAKDLGLTASQTEALVDTTTALTLRAADGSTVVENFNKILNGEGEALRKLGVDLDTTSDKFKGLDENSKKTYRALTVQSQAAAKGITAAKEAADSQAAGIYQAQATWDNFVSTLQQAAADELAAAGGTEALSSALADLAPIGVGAIKIAAAAAREFRRWQEDAYKLARTIGGMRDETIKASDGAKVHEQAGWNWVAMAKQSGGAQDFINRMTLRYNRLNSDAINLTQEQTRAQYELAIARERNVSAMVAGIAASTNAASRQKELDDLLAAYRAARAKLSGVGSADSGFFELIPSEMQVRQALAVVSIETKNTMLDLSEYLRALDPWRPLVDGLREVAAESMSYQAQLGRAVQGIGGKLQKMGGALSEQASVSLQSSNDIRDSQIATAFAIGEGAQQMLAAYGEAGIGQAIIGGTLATARAFLELSKGNTPGFVAGLSSAATYAIAEMQSRRYAGGGGGGGGGRAAPAAVSASVPLATERTTEGTGTQERETILQLMVDGRELGRAAIEGANKSRRFGNTTLDARIVGGMGRSL